MRVCALICLLLLSTLAKAESTLPQGCQAIAVQGESVALKAKKAKLFFIHNITGYDLWITHPVTNPSASAGWSSRLQSENWSALVIDKGPFDITCIESRPGHEQQIPCEGAIAVCQWTGGKIPASKGGDFWASEDLSLSALISAIGGRGFVLPKAK